MKNRNRYWPLCILLLLSLLNSCRSEQASDFPIREDIFQAVRPYFQESTDEIIFGHDSNPQRFFLHGWNEPSERHTWADGRKSGLVFYQYNTQEDGEIAIICKSVRPQGRQKALEQTTKVFLNEHEIGSFVAQPSQFEEFTLLLPQEFLEPGRNTLEFEFTFFYQGKHDTRRKSVAFRHIRFADNESVKHINEREILQHKDAKLNLFWELPEKFWLDVSYQSLKDAKTSLEFAGEGQKVTRIRLTSGKQQYSKPVQLPAAGIYDIRLITEGAEESHTAWKELSVRLPLLQEATAKPEETEGFTKRAKPDIVLYVVDTLRADHLHCYGYERETSPNIDAFAEENAFFQNAYAADSWTRASAATIFTGLMPKNHKTMSRTDILPEELVTLAEILQENGYYTAGFVSNWNLHEVFGLHQGFEKYKEFLRNPKNQLPTHSATINKDVFTFLRKFTEDPERPPLFLMVWTVDPHDPYSPEPEVEDMFGIENFEYIDTSSRSLLNQLYTGKIQPSASQLEYIKTRYDQEIYFNDRSFGHLLEELRQLNMYDDAVVMFTGDHGEEFLDHKGYGHGRTLYDEQIRIPFMLKASQLPSGSYEHRMQHIDIYPTVLDLLGITAPYHLDGISLLTHSDPLRELYFEEELNGNSLTAMLDDQKKIIYNKSFERPPLNEKIPRIEIFEHSDRHEQTPLDIQDYADKLRRQRLLTYTQRDAHIGAQHTQSELSPELDETLKELGYVK